MTINDNTKEIINNIKQGKVVCFKTDTIWGFSANSINKEAITNLYTIKNRNLDKPFIFLIKQDEDILKYVKEISQNALKLISTFWPGKLTIIFEAKDNNPLLKHYKNKKTIAFRMPKNELCQDILQHLDNPIPSTSVNKEGEVPLNNFDDICNNFANEDYFILRPQQDNNRKKEAIDLSNNNASTIVSCIGNEVTILREGTISKQDILKCINS